jgi:hypothetical protein
LFELCRAHFTASCDVCQSSHRVDELAADPFAVPPRPFLCPLCRADLTGEVIAHVEACPAFHLVSEHPAR